ncbi:hypothetical protein D3C80_1505520 [compost metagenome]
MQRFFNQRQPRSLKLARIGGDTLFCQLQFKLIGMEQFGGKTPQAIQRLLHFLVADGAAVTQTDHPATAETQVVMRLFQ